MRALLSATIIMLTSYGALFSGLTPAALAGPEGERYASISVDADSQDILHARQIDALRYPASLTKMMTLYLAFDALDARRLDLNDALPVSAKAAAAPPTKLGLKAKQSLTLHDAIQALAVKSSNDVAIVIAEAIGGTEENFALLMNAKAQSLGMMATHYKNASGLPNSKQVTTARDQAKLADALLRHHKKYYHYFGQESFYWKGQRLKNHNSLLSSVQGVDGFKTGYTRASGFNLTISAQRNGRRIIAVVLGGASGMARDQHMARLIDRSFDVIGNRPTHIAITAPDTNFIRQTVREPTPLQAFEMRGRQGENMHIITGDGASSAVCRAVASTDKSCLIIPQ